jgi:hypothetical protein
VMGARFGFERRSPQTHSPLLQRHCRKDLRYYRRAARSGPQEAQDKTCKRSQAYAYVILAATPALAQAPGATGDVPWVCIILAVSGTWRYKKRYR